MVLIGTLKIWSEKTMLRESVFKHSGPFSQADGLTERPQESEQEARVLKSTFTKSHSGHNGPRKSLTDAWKSLFKKTWLYHFAEISYT